MDQEWLVMLAALVVAIVAVVGVLQVRQRRRARKAAAEIERLRADRDLEKKWRKDAEDQRETLLDALRELEGLVGDDKASTDWRGRWAHLLALREGPVQFQSAAASTTATS